MGLKCIVTALLIAFQTYAVTLTRDTVFEVGYAGSAGPVAISNNGSDTLTIDSIQIRVDKARFPNYEISFRMIPCSSLLCPMPCVGESDAGACPSPADYNRSALIQKIRLAPGASITLSDFRIGYCIRCISGKSASVGPSSDTIVATIILFWRGDSTRLTLIGGYEGKAGIGPQPMRRSSIGHHNSRSYIVDVQGNRIAAPAAIRNEMQGVPLGLPAGISQGIYFLVDPGSSRMVSSYLNVK